MVDFAAAFVVWAVTETAVSEINASAIPAATLVCEMNRFLMFKPPRLLAKRLLPIWAIQQFLDKFHALEIQNLHVLFLAPVQRHADFPGAREYLRVFDRRLERNYIGTDTGVPLHHVQLVAVKISGTVKPRFIDHVGDIDHQGFALPVSDGPAH